MAFDIKNILIILQIAIQIVAAYSAYIIYQYNRISKAWLAVIIALILMTLRRVTVLLINFDILPQLTGSIQLFDSIVLPFLISIFLAWGMWTMAKSFRGFELLEKKVSEKFLKYKRIKKIK